MTTSTQFVQPNWAAIAAQQWPHAKIEGSGQFALVLSCAERPTVRLFDFRMEAVAVKNQPCRHAFCRMKHNGIILKELPREKYFRKSTNISRMIEATA